MTNTTALTPQSPPNHQVISRPYHFCYPNLQNSIPISKFYPADFGRYRPNIAITARLDIRIFFMNDVPNWKRYRGLILMLIHIITRYRPNVDLQMIFEN